MRYIILDTETTGLTADTNRIFEIGCVELVSENGEKRLTGREYQQYLSTPVKISKEVFEICKISNEFLEDKPPFEKIVDDFLKFINTDENGKEDMPVLVAHNINFDLSFLNMELEKAGKPNLKDFFGVDTVKLAKFREPGKLANLDALCKKFEINLGSREDNGHGALLDSKLLAQVFLKLWGDDDDEFLRTYNKTEEEFLGFAKRETPLESREFGLSTVEAKAHEALLAAIKAEQW